MFAQASPTTITADPRLAISRHWIRCALWSRRRPRGDVRPDYDRGRFSAVRDLRVRSLHCCRPRDEPAIYRSGLRRCSERHRLRMRRGCPSSLLGHPVPATLSAVAVVCWL